MRKSLRQMEEWTQLKRVLWLHGQFRRCLEPIGVTPLQAGVLLPLHRHRGNKDDEDRCGMRRCSMTDTRVVQLRLSPRGNALVGKIKKGVGHVGALTQQD
jgi:hypothetical protein